MSDGASVYECRSGDEVIDLLQGGQGVFGIAIGGVWKEMRVDAPVCPRSRDLLGRLAKLSIARGRVRPGDAEGAIPPRNLSGTKDHAT